MVVKRNTSNMFWIILSSVSLLAVLMMALMMVQTSKTSPNSPPSQPVIVVNGGGSVQDQSPVYPKHLPKYSNPQQPLDYQQIGVLTSHESEKEPIILPLYGRKIYGRSDRWQYYTATDKNNMMRLPLEFENRDCEDENTGCREITSGDKLAIDIYRDREFTATVYKTEAPRYFAEPY